MKCLIIKNDGIGDLVISSGVIHKLTKEFDQLDLVTCIQNKDIAESIPGINQIYYTSRDSLAINAEGQPVISLFDQSMLKQLDQNYDVAILLRRFIRESCISLMNLIKAKNKYCSWEYTTNFEMTPEIKKSISSWKQIQTDPKIVHELTYYKLFLEKALDLNFEKSFPVLIQPENIQKSKDFVSIGIDSKGIDHAEWKLIAKYLIGKNKKIKIFGNSSYASTLAKQIEETYPQDVLNLVGRTSIKNAHKEIAETDLYIGNDTGLSHLASTCVSAVIVPHGGGGLGRFFPWPDSKNQTIIYTGMSCFDCAWECHFGQFFCLTLLKFEKMKPILDQILNGERVEALINLDSNEASITMNWRLHYKFDTLQSLPFSCDLSEYLEASYCEKAIDTRINHKRIILPPFRLRLKNYAKRIVKKMIAKLGHFQYIYNKYFYIRGN